MQACGRRALQGKWRGQISTLIEPTGKLSHRVITRSSASFYRPSDSASFPLLPCQPCAIPCPMRKKSGFTLIELMMTIAILSVLIAVAAPAVGNMVKNNRLRGQAFDFVGAINLARSEAVRRKVPTALCRSENDTSVATKCIGSWSDGFIIFTDPGKNGTFQAADDTLIRRGLVNAAGVMTIVGNTAAQFSLQFATDGSLLTSSGLASTDAARISICDDRGATYGRQIVIQPVGRPKIILGRDTDISCSSPAS